MKNINRSTLYIALGTLITGLILGWFIFGGHKDEHSEHSVESGHSSEIWTCAMHPQIRQNEPGNCPICGMPLQLLTSEGHPMEIKMSPTAMQLANVRTALVSKERPAKEVRLNGKVSVDERRIFSQSSHIPGRIEKLLVSFTGESIQMGQVLAYVYSPDLVTAQEELIEAFKIKESQPQLYRAARGKLLNWKLTDAQIDRIIESGEIQDQFPIRADVSGVVLNRNVNLGDYIRKGEALFEVADLSVVWVQFDIYESDMTWVHKGDEMEFTIQSLPSEKFRGKITFIDPFIHPRKRVASARVEISNTGMRLKPDMFALGLVKSPMQGNTEELIVPKSAVMWTGERSVVYVKSGSTSDVSFMLREVILGPSVGDNYIIKSGLSEGEEIAVSGAFSIDAAAQLAGKPSMMNPNGSAGSFDHNHAHSIDNTTAVDPITVEREARSVVKSLFDQYLAIKNALIEDKYEQGKKLSGVLLSSMESVNMAMFEGKAHDAWMEHQSKGVKALQAMQKGKNIGEVRSEFRKLSDQFILMAIQFGPFESPLYIQHCPMANDNKGADWISNDSQILNPYFGESMIGCGSVTKEIKK